LTIETDLNSVKIKTAAARPKRPPRQAYHHGDLRRALIAAAEDIIMERGVDGFTLREAARRAGVSPAAPAHHFKDARGLLTEVALLGFRDFGAVLAAADRRGGQDPGRRLREQGIAYVSFALRHPARFQLMFRADKHDRDNAELVRAARQSYAVLEAAIRAALGSAATRRLDLAGNGLLIANWSLVHGFAHLALGGELAGPGRGRGAAAILKSLLPRVLEHLPSPSRRQPRL
jgi:AcrR family transcriptional regulator